MIIYVLTFDLFDDVEKNIGISHANHSATYKAILTKMHLPPVRQYFLFAITLGIIHDDRFVRKNTKNNYFLQVKPPFSADEFSNNVTFRRNARFDVILTSITIIKRFPSHIDLLT